MQLFEQETNEAARLAENLGYGIAIFQGLTNFFLNTLVLSTLFMGGHLMSTESLTPGALMAFLVASQGVQRSLSQGSVLLGTMIRGMSAGSRVFEYLALQPKVELLRGYIIPQERLHGEIRFENVSFAYPMRPDQVSEREKEKRGLQAEYNDYHSLPACAEGLQSDAASGPDSCVGRCQRIG